MLRSLLIATTFLLLTLSSMAQSKLVTGKFEDEKTNRPVDELEVSIVNLATKKKFTVETDEEGVFKFKNIPWFV